MIQILEKSSFGSKLASLTLAAPWHMAPAAAAAASILPHDKEAELFNESMIKSNIFYFTTGSKKHILIRRMELIAAIEPCRCIV
jgi:hypothetical protein